MFFALSASQQTDCAIPIMTDSCKKPAVACFCHGRLFIWGLFPLYWKPLGQTPALQILCHRIVWSAVFVAGVLLWQRHWAWLAVSVPPACLGCLSPRRCCCR